MKIHKGNVIFVTIVITLLIIFIGFDYIKQVILESNHRYTIGYVTDYKQFVRTYNNRIHYTFSVNGKQYESEFRSSELTSDLKGKRIVVKFSSLFPRINIPNHKQVILNDCTAPPADGWDKEPNGILELK